MNEALMQHLLRVAKSLRGTKYDHRTWTANHGKPGCIGGHCCFDAEFKRAGLRMSKGHYKVPLFGPAGNEWMSEDAFKHLLGLNDVEALFIFGTPLQVSTIEDDAEIAYGKTYHDVEYLIRRIERVMAGEFASVEYHDVPGLYLAGS